VYVMVITHLVQMHAAYQMATHLQIAMATVLLAMKAGLAMAYVMTVHGGLTLYVWIVMVVTASRTQTQMQLATHVILPIVLVSVPKAMKAGLAMAGAMMVPMVFILTVMNLTVITVTVMTVAVVVSLDHLAVIMPVVPI